MLRIEYNPYNRIFKVQLLFFDWRPVNVIPANLISFAADTPGITYAFVNSDAVGQGICVVLVVVSIFVWSFMLTKWLSLRRAKRLSNQFLHHFRQSQTLTGALNDARNNPGPVAIVYTAGLNQLLEFYTTNSRRRSHDMGAGDIPGPQRLTPAQFDAVQAVLEREVSQELMKLEEGIGWLATCVSAAPFGGLFGTVWGVMYAFCAAAINRSVAIDSLAPGVAGALLTTVFGLVVAIPSLIWYNMLTNSIRKLTVAMDTFVEDFLVRIKLEQLTIDSDEDVIAERRSAPIRSSVPAMTATTPASAVAPQPQVAVRPVAQEPAVTSVSTPIPAQTYETPEITQIQTPVQPTPAQPLPPVQQSVPAYSASAPQSTSSYNPPPPPPVQQPAVQISPASVPRTPAYNSPPPVQNPAPGYAAPQVPVQSAAYPSNGRGIPVNAQSAAIPSAPRPANPYYRPPAALNTSASAQSTSPSPQTPPADRWINPVYNRPADDAAENPYD